MLPIVYGHQHAQTPPAQFPIAYDRMPALARHLLAVRPDTALAVIDDGVLELRFGRCRLVTQLANVAAVETERPDIEASVIGIRLSPRGKGLIIGTERGSSGSGGTVCMRFRRLVSVVAPTVVVRCAWIAVITSSPTELAAALSGVIDTDGHPGRSPLADRPGPGRATIAPDVPGRSSSKKCVRPAQRPGHR